MREACQPLAALAPELSQRPEKRDILTELSPFVVTANRLEIGSSAEDHARIDAGENDKRHHHHEGQRDTD